MSNQNPKIFRLICYFYISQIIIIALANIKAFTGCKSLYSKLTERSINICRGGLHWPHQLNLRSFRDQLKLVNLPELVELPLVVNKAISQVPRHHKLQRSTCLLLIVDRVHLREPETTVQSVLEWNKAYRLLFISTERGRVLIYRNGNI